MSGRAPGNIYGPIAGENVTGFGETVEHRMSGKAFFDRVYKYVIEPTFEDQGKIYILCANSLARGKLA